MWRSEYFQWDWLEYQIEFRKIRKIVHFTICTSAHLTCIQGGEVQNEWSKQSRMLQKINSWYFVYAKLIATHWNFYCIYNIVMTAVNSRDNRKRESLTIDAEKSEKLRGACPRVCFIKINPHAWNIRVQICICPYIYMFIAYMQIRARVERANTQKVWVALAYVRTQCRNGVFWETKSNECIFKISLIIVRWVCDSFLYHA